MTSDARWSVVLAYIAIVSCSPTAAPTDAGSGGGTDSPGTDSPPAGSDGGGGSTLGTCSPLPVETCSVDGWCSSRPFFASMFSVHAVAVDDVWFGGRGIAHFDGTQVCALAPSIGSGRSFGIHGVASDDIWFVGDDSVIAHWDGSSARALMGPITSGGIHFRSVWAASATDAWAVGERTIAHWDGSTWTLADAPSAMRGGLEHVRGLDPTHVWAVSDDEVGPDQGDVLEWDGSAWNIVYSGAYDFAEVRPVTPTLVYVVGNAGATGSRGGHVLSGPGTWTEVSAGTWSVELNSVAVRASGELRVFGDNAIVHRMTAGSWVEELTGLAHPTDPLLGPALYEAAITADTIYLAGKDGYLLRRAF